MHRRWGRWFLTVVAIAATAGACLWTMELESRLRATRQTAVTATLHAAGARTALAEVRRALAAMASPGQAAVGWSRRAAAGIEDARSQVSALAAIAPAPAAAPGTSRQSAGDVLDRLGEAERRLRDHAVGGKPLMAADVAFGEAMPLVETLERQVVDAQSAVSTAADREVAALRDGQVMALAAALGSLLVAALCLTPLPRGRPIEMPEVSPDAAGIPEPFIDVPLGPDPLPSPPSPRLPTAAALGELAALAAVCDELARLAHAEALPQVLERVAAVLGARGVMVWLGDADRRHLRPVAAAGYDARLLDRLGPVAVNDDNPTARAFATGESIVAAPGPGRPAAVSVPIAGASGVCGVLSAELMTTDATLAAASVAAARVMAAQLAGLVAPPEAPAALEAQGQ